MKKGFFALAAMVVFFACNDGVADGTANRDDNNDHMEQASRNTEDNREIYRAIETGDVSKLDSFIAEDIVDHEGNMGKDIVGRDSVKQFISKIHTYFDGLKVESIADATSADGQYHFAMVRMTGKAKANPWGMPVGADVDDTSIDVVKIRDGKAVEHWGFTSQKDMMEMMGAMGGGQMPTMKDGANR